MCTLQLPKQMSSEIVDKQSKGCFYGVYLLCSQSMEQRYHGKCYIGFTVNPNRRIKQHNRGHDFGGAKKTSNKGPWQMVIIVHGFPNNIAALQFEWAWQQPMLSSRLKYFPELKRKRPKETCFAYNFRILNRMLTVGPWQRLPLVIRWLETDYECGFAPNIPLPTHMKIVSGKISITKSTSFSKYTNHKHEVASRAICLTQCHLCMQCIEQPERGRIGCLNSLCNLTCHIICLANHMLSNNASNRGHYIPIEGECPICETHLTWAALLRKQRMQSAAGHETKEINYSDSCDSDVSTNFSDVDTSDFEEPICNTDEVNILSD